MEKRKKVLIISYYWYPCGGIGVLRCLKLAKYLRNFGWEPIIYTAENAHYPSYDEGNLKDIPENLTVLKQPIFEPYEFYRLFTGQPKNANVNHALVASDQKRGFRHKLSVWIRSNLFIPDARAFWIKPSVKFLLNYLKTNPVDAIFSDGPPQTNNVIACKIKEKTGIPWLADFQDPWTQVDLYERLILTSWADRKYHALEQETFKNANKITIASPSWKKDLENIGAKNVSVFYWGYDQSDFEKLTPNLTKKFTLTHTGLLGEDRLPDKLFLAIRELMNEIPEFAADFCLQLIGHIDGIIKQSIDNQGISKNVMYISQMERHQALNYTANSQLLLILLNKAGNFMGRIPGKLFEYLAVRRPILCLGAKKSDVDNILTSCEAGFSTEYENLTEIKNWLKTNYFLFKENKIVPCQTKNIEEFTNIELTKKIAGFLDEISLKK